MSLYLLLVHGPVLGPRDDLINTATTPLDVTDIARSARTYECDGFGIIQPDINQRALADRVTGFWTSNNERANLRSRQQALGLARSFDSVEDAINTWGDGVIVATSALAGKGTISWATLQNQCSVMNGQTTYLLFGTGYGLANVHMDLADSVAPAIHGPGAYAHLSVRSAVAIVLDRIRGVSDA